MDHQVQAVDLGPYRDLWLQEEMVDELKKKLSPLDKLEQRTNTMEDTIAKLVKQQQKTRRLLMTIFFTGIVPLLAFLTALVLKVLVLT